MLYAIAVGQTDNKRALSSDLELIVNGKYFIVCFHTFVYYLL